jgi:hypothetical protein
VLRIQHGDLTLDEFAHLMRPTNEIGTDQLAVLLTSLQEIKKH